MHLFVCNPVLLITPPLLMEVQTWHPVAVLGEAVVRVAETMLDVEIETSFGHWKTARQRMDI